jgi:serine/threonine-protein kinase
MQTTLNNRYQIIQMLGKGGFGNTFLAEDTQMPSRRRCVIKQLKPVTENPQIYQLIQGRFQREAAILEALGEGTDQIPKLFAYFSEGGHFYLVQEWVDGQTLTQKVQAEGALAEPVVQQILMNLLPVLDYIHSHQIVHRDIKPDNIMMRQRDGKTILIDFGAVKESMGTVLDSQGNSASSIVVGTPGFMPAEQLAGRPVFASDLYSLGLTAIYLLTGRLPQSLTVDPMSGEILWHSHAPQTSPQFVAILNQAIQSHPRDRYPTARAMLAALQAGNSPMLAAAAPLPETEASLPTPGLFSPPTPPPQSSSSSARPSVPATTAPTLVASPTADPSHQSDRSAQSSSPSPSRRSPAILMGGLIAGSTIGAAIATAVVLMRSGQSPSPITQETTTPTSTPTSTSTSTPTPTANHGSASPVPTNNPVVVAPVPQTTLEISPSQPVPVATVPTVSPQPQPRPTVTVTATPSPTRDTSQEPTAASRPLVSTQRVSFQPGATNATVQGRVTSNQIQRYLLRCLAQQQFRVEILQGEIAVVITDPDGRTLGNTGGGTTQWQGTLPRTGDYRVEISASESARYAVNIEVF